MIWAIIPVKPLRESKSRLSAVLTPEERARLTGFLLQRTLGILSKIPAIDRIMVVSRDPEALKVARQGGAITLVEGDRPGLNVALLRAAYVAAARRASSLLILPSDLPLLTEADVQMMLIGAMPANGLRPVTGMANGHSNGYQNGHSTNSPNGHNKDHLHSPNGHLNGVNGHINGTQGSVTVHDATATNPRLVLPEYPKAITICPDHHEDGTNALFIRPAIGFTFRYGPDSFHQHIQEAEQHGMFYRVVHAPGIKFDLDTEADWMMYQTIFRQETG
ncbi:MAG: NTP transferase domain-containing protein [Chloroflexi bacterium]|nr:NTP transferase domain-containing protein [Chloroflexota bacterium]MBP8059321.1 NTP transferase domain-containing protein [Chloroflexota bacterium]